MTTRKLRGQWKKNVKQRITQLPSGQPLSESKNELTDFNGKRTYSKIYRQICAVSGAVIYPRFFLSPFGMAEKRLAVDLETKIEAKVELRK